MFFYKNFGLIKQLTIQDIKSKYKGTQFGLSWALINPLLLLLIYSFVFTVVFQSRWGGIGPNKESIYPIIIFSGLIIHFFFSEVISRSTFILSQNINFIKKIVFPIELFPVIVVCSSFFNFSISIFLLLAAFLLINGSIYWTIIFLPIILFPFVILSLGLSFFISSISIFLKDLTQIISLLCTVLLFMSPAFYPVENLPKAFQIIIYFNPITIIISELRNIIILGKTPNPIYLFLYYLVSILILKLGLKFFKSLKRSFSDFI